jgi:ribosomal subunit interface protein
MIDHKVEYVDMSPSDALNALIAKELEKVSKKYDFLVKVEVYIKKENDPKGKGCVSEMKVSLPGPQIFASSDEENFEMSVRETARDIDRQLAKRKDEMKRHR